MPDGERREVPATHRAGTPGNVSDGTGDAAADGAAVANSGVINGSVTVTTAPRPRVSVTVLTVGLVVVLGLSVITISLLGTAFVGGGGIVVTRSPSTADQSGGVHPPGASSNSEPPTTEPSAGRREGPITLNAGAQADPDSTDPARGIVPKGDGSLVITSPSPRFMADGSGKIPLRGTASLDQHQHLWVYLDGDYIPPLEVKHVSVTAGAWKVVLYFNPDEHGDYFVQAVVVDEEDNQTLKETRDPRRLSGRQKETRIDVSCCS